MVRSALGNPLDVDVYYAGLLRAIWKKHESEYVGGMAYIGVEVGKRLDPDGGRWNAILCEVPSERNHIAPEDMPHLHRDSEWDAVL